MGGLGGGGEGGPGNIQFETWRIVLLFESTSKEVQVSALSIGSQWFLAHCFLLFFPFLPFFLSLSMRSFSLFGFFCFLLLLFFVRLFFASSFFSFPSFLLAFLLTFCFLFILISVLFIYLSIYLSFIYLSVYSFVSLLISFGMHNSLGSHDAHTMGEETISSHK